jgi:hypothetical protein
MRVISRGAGGALEKNMNDKGSTKDVGETSKKGHKYKGRDSSKKTFCDVHILRSTRAQQ